MATLDDYKRLYGGNKKNNTLDDYRKLYPKPGSYTPQPQQQASPVTAPETPAPINRSMSLNFIKTGFNKLTDTIASTQLFKDIGVGLNKMEEEGRPSMAEAVLKPASFGFTNPENIPFGVGEVVKQGKAYINDPYAKPITFSDWLTGMKQGGQGFVKSIASGATEIPSLVTAGQYQPEIKFNLPGIGDVSNSDYKIAERVAKGEDPNMVVLSEKTTGFMNALFFIGLATKPFLSRPTVVSKGTVPAESGITVTKPLQSFKMYEAPKYTQPLTPAFMDKMQTQKGINFGPKYDPSLPSYFRMTSGSNGKIVGEIVQVKPSYFSILKDKLFGDVTKIPPEGVNVLTTRGTNINQLENVKSAPVKLTPEQVVNNHLASGHQVVQAGGIESLGGEKALVESLKSDMVQALKSYGLDSSKVASINTSGINTLAEFEQALKAAKIPVTVPVVPPITSPAIPKAEIEYKIDQITKAIELNPKDEQAVIGARHLAEQSGDPALVNQVEQAIATGEANLKQQDETQTKLDTFVEQGKVTPESELTRPVSDPYPQAPRIPTTNQVYSGYKFTSGIYEGQPYTTDGHILEFNSKVTPPKKSEFVTGKDAIAESGVKKIIPDQTEAVSVEPIKVQADESANQVFVTLEGEGVTTNVQKKYYDYFIKKYPGVKFMAVEPFKPIVVTSKGEMVGLVMPADLSNAKFKTAPVWEKAKPVQPSLTQTEKVKKPAVKEKEKKDVAKTEAKPKVKEIAKTEKKMAGPITQKIAVVRTEEGATFQLQTIQDGKVISKSNFSTRAEAESEMTPTPSGTAQAKYQPSDLPNLSGEFGGINNIKPIEMPELVRMTRELMGNFPEIVKSTGNAAGRFYPKDDGRIKLIASLFNKAGADVNQGARVLAHEMGHLIDYLPDHMIKRGNLLGRLQVLRKFMEAELDGVKNADIKKELLAVTQYWHPYNPKQVTETYRKYRESAVELYAEALSMLLVDPAKLEKMAPMFYKEFFKSLDKKPDVMEAYFKTQELLSGEPEALFEARMNDILAGFKRGEAVQADFRAKKELSDKSLWEKLRQQVDDKNYPIIKKQRLAEEKGVVFPDAENPKYVLEEQALTDNENFLMVESIQKKVMEPLTKIGVTQEDLGQYLMLNRISTERAEIANPYGFDVKTAKEQLAFLKKTLGAERYSALEEGAKKFQDIIFPSVEEAVKVGSYNKELFETKIKPNKGNYAAFQVIDYMQDHMPAGIKAQTGTLKEISNPFISTILKTISLNRLNAFQRSKNATVNMLKDNFSSEISRSEPIMSGAVRIGFKRVEDREHLQMLEDGKLVSYNVDPYIAKSFETLSAGELNVLVHAADVFNNKLFKPLVTTYNLGFALGTNPIRDIKRNYKNIPNATVYSLLKAYVGSLGQAVKYSKGELDDFTRQLVESKALGAPINDYNYDPIETEYGAILERMGLVKETPKISNRFLAAVAKPTIQLLEGLRFVANTFENISKIAGAKVRMAGGESGSELAYNLRNYTGTPNYRNKGTHTKTTNALFVFSNIMKEGLKSDFQIATNPKTRSGYWWKTVKVDLVPKLLQFLAAAGVGGAVLKKFYDNVSEYDKTNYIIIPLGYNDGKAVYARIPHDETGRLIAATFWKTANFAKERKLTDAQQILAMGAGQFPSLTPLYNIGVNWTQYLSGKNPYDSFRGKNLIDDTTWQAGGGAALKKMVEWTTNSIGLTKFATYDDATKSTIETFMQFAPWFSSMIKISDYGITESLNEVAKEQKQKEAQQTLKVRDAIFNNLKPALADKPENVGTYLSKTITDSIGYPPVGGTQAQIDSYISEAKAITSKFTRAFVLGTSNDPIEKAVSGATSNAQKAEMLRYITNGKDAPEIKDLLNRLIEDKVISPKVIEMLYTPKQDRPISQAEKPSRFLSLINNVLGVKTAEAAEMPAADSVSVKDLKFSENGVPYFWKDKKATDIDKITIEKKPVAPINSIKIVDPRPGYSKTITDPAKLKVAEQIASISNAVAPEYTNYLLRVAQYEGTLDPKAKNDKGNNLGGVDRGLFQINSKAFPQITDAQAHDVQFSTLWAIALIQAGKQDKWNADKLIKGKVKLEIS